MLKLVSVIPDDRLSYMRSQSVTPPSCMWKLNLPKTTSHFLKTNASRQNMPTQYDSIQKFSRYHANVLLNYWTQFCVPFTIPFKYKRTFFLPFTPAWTSGEINKTHRITHTTDETKHAAASSCASEQNYFNKIATANPQCPTFKLLDLFEVKVLKNCT